MNRTSSNQRTTRPEREASGPRRWLSTIVIALMLALAFGGPSALPLAQVVSAQDAANPTPDPASQDAAEETPVVPNDPTAPQSQSGQEAEETPAPEQTNQQPQQSAQAGGDTATETGSPAVLAHGLAFLSGDQVVWQVRETEMPAVEDAEATTSNAAVMLQRDGSTIVRNDVTGKRAKLDPGEAYFRAADDSYTAVADSDGSVAWTFELVLSNDVADDAFYESPLIDDLGEGVYDMMLTRYVLQPGESAPLPAHTGPALLMVSTGEIDVEDDSGLSTLAASDGQLMPGEGTVTNNSDSPSVYVVAMLGDEVSDDTAAAPQAEETPAATEETTTEETTTEETPVEEAPAEEAAAEESGAFQTSIDVTANAEIYLIIIADGVTVFDGTLPAGSSSGAVVGSAFEVYTSSGVNTVFTNACGDTFQMGYEEGEVTYFLAADANSCAP